MVLPRDSIPPVLDGARLASVASPKNTGLLISLLGDPVEIVVPNEISVRYLQTTDDGGHVFRVSQRFRLRVKDRRRSPSSALHDRPRSPPGPAPPHGCHG